MIKSTSYKQKVIRRYDKLSRYYDSLDSGISKASVKRRELAVKFLNIEPGDIVLDVGTGSGVILPLIARKLERVKSAEDTGGTVIGIDLSTGMLDKARKNIPDEFRDRVILKIDDVEAMSFPNDHFDSLIATYTLTTVPEPGMMMEECYRVLKPGGVFVMLDTGPPSKKYGYPIYWWMRLSAALFGYTFINRRYTDYLHPGFEIIGEERFYGTTVYIVVLKKVEQS